MDEQSLFDLLKRELFTAVIGDVLDRLGHRHQFLPAAIRPLHADMVVAGRACPVIHTPGPPPDGSRFGRMLEALDSLRPGEVYLTDAAGEPCSVWGELMSTRARRLGAAGVVINGYHRDTRGILALNFPTFSHGAFAQDVAGRGHVSAFRVPMQIGAVSIEPGDLIFGDLDGVIVVPEGLVKPVIEEALEKVRGENLVRKAFEDNMTAVEAFERYEVM